MNTAVLQTPTLSPAQRAWQTRRAKLAGSAAAPVAASIEAKAAPVVRAPYVEPEWMKPRVIAKVEDLPDAMEPVTEFRPVDLWLDDALVGCGLRRFVVLEIGERMVKLFCAPQLVTVTVARKYFEKHAREAKANRKTVARIIRERVAFADTVNNRQQRDVLPDGGVAAQRALALVEGRN